jgi:hypothetical protein
MRPSRSRITWSAMLIASAWSCVTYTIVIPSFCCSPANLAAHLVAQLRVEIRQRLVHQAHRLLGDDRPSERHTLLLAAGELVRLALEQFREAEQFGHTSKALLLLRLARLSHLQAEQDVLRRPTDAGKAHTTGTPSTSDGATAAAP